MDQKIAFIREWESGQFHFNSLCKFYGISRPTGYALIERYKKEGINAFENYSRKPRSHPNSTSKEIVQLVKLWRKKKNWGAKKIRVKIVALLGDKVVHSLTAIHNILVKEGFMTPKKHK